VSLSLLFAAGKEPEKELRIILPSEWEDGTFRALLRFMAAKI